MTTEVRRTIKIWQAGWTVRGVLLEWRGVWLLNFDDGRNNLPGHADPAASLLSSHVVGDDPEEWCHLPPRTASCGGRAYSPESDSSPRNQCENETTICWGYLSEADTPLAGIKHVAGNRSAANENTAQAAVTLTSRLTV